MDFAFEGTVGGIPQNQNRLLILAVADNVQRVPRLDIDA